MGTAIDNPFWTALTTRHAALAIVAPQARRYPADVLPIAAVETPTAEALTALRELLLPGEEVYVTGDLPVVPGLACTAALPCLQMHYPEAATPEKPVLDGYAIRPLEPREAPEMVALTDLAFPGFFRPRTYVLGSYFGVRAAAGTLIAMAGERAVLPGAREISAVCTHPQHTGHGLASALIRHLLRLHGDAGNASFLHVVAANKRAVELYFRLGFVSTQSLVFNRLQRATA